MNFIIHTRIILKTPGPLLFSIFLILLCVTKAGAQATFTTNESEFNASNVLIMQDFQEGNVGAGQLLVCGVVVDSQGGGPCFNPSVIAPGLEIATSAIFDLVLVGEDAGNSQNPFNALVNGEVSSLNVIFTNGQTLAAGVNVGCITALGEVFCNDTLRVSAFGAGDTPLGSVDVPATSRFDTFVGVASTEPITRINVNTTTGDQGVRFQGVDKVSFGRPSISPIPTLSEWALIATAGILGVTGLFAVSRKRPLA